MGALYRRCGGGWGTGCGWCHATARHGAAWGQHGGQVARRALQQPGRGARRQRATDIEIGGAGADRWARYSPRQQCFEYISNSNEFKLLQNLSNFD
jgi:hypothetical protein